jgi:hypothetical protein
MRPRIVKILPIVYCFIAVIPMLSQGPTAGAGPPWPSRNPPELPMPIDDNILILLIVGLFYGFYTIVKKNRATNTL